MPDIEMQPMKDRCIINNLENKRLIVTGMFGLDGIFISRRKIKFKKV